MITCLLFLGTGFVLGLVYSRGRANPVEAAWIDAKRITASVCARTAELFQEIRDRCKRSSRPRKTRK